MTVSGNDYSPADLTGVEQLLTQIDEKLGTLLPEGETEPETEEIVSGNTIELMQHQAMLLETQNKQLFILSAVLMVAVGMIAGFMFIKAFKA